MKSTFFSNIKRVGRCFFPEKLIRSTARLLGRWKYLRTFSSKLPITAYDREKHLWLCIVQKTIICRYRWSRNKNIWTLKKQDWKGFHLIGCSCDDKSYRLMTILAVKKLWSVNIDLHLKDIEFQIDKNYNGFLIFLWTQIDFLLINTLQCICDSH